MQLLDFIRHNGNPLDAYQVAAREQLPDAVPIVRNDYVNATSQLCLNTQPTYSP